MPLYELVAICSHYDKYVRSRHLSCAPPRPNLARPVAHVPPFSPSSQKPIRDLVRSTALHILEHGGQVRSIKSWGTLPLPEKMRRHKVTHSYGELVLSRSALPSFLPAGSSSLGMENAQIADAVMHDSYYVVQFDCSPLTLKALDKAYQADPRVVRWTNIKLGESCVLPPYSRLLNILSTKLISSPLVVGLDQVEGDRQAATPDDKLGLKRARAKVPPSVPARPVAPNGLFVCRRRQCARGGFVTRRSGSGRSGGGYVCEFVGRGAERSFGKVGVRRRRMAKWKRFHYFLPERSYEAGGSRKRRRPKGGRGRSLLGLVD